jgi:hypothetical protein
MNFLPVTSDMQTLELAYSLHKSLSRQCVSFNKCTDISLGLIETNGLKAVLTAQPTLLNLEKTVITLHRVKAGALENGEVVVRLEPIQQMNLHFELAKAIIDDIPLMLPEDTPYYTLVQHLVMGRLEYILTEMDVFHLSFDKARMPEKFTELLKLRAYRYSEGIYNKHLLMTNTVNVMP